MAGDYWPGEYVYPVGRQDEIEQALRDLGFTMIRGDLGYDGAFLNRWHP